AEDDDIDPVGSARPGTSDYFGVRGFIPAFNFGMALTVSNPLVPNIAIVTPLSILAQSGPKLIVGAIVGCFFTSTCATPFLIGCISPSENTEKNRAFNTFGIT